MAQDFPLHLSVFLRPTDRQAALTPSGSAPQTAKVIHSYDATSNLSGHVPQYSGVVSMKTERWPQTSAPTPNTRECYVYDHAGRLAKSGRQGSFREYAYDSRGNILSETLPGSSGSFSYEYDGDRPVDDLQLP